MDHRENVKAKTALMVEAVKKATRLKVEVDDASKKYRALESQWMAAQREAAVAEAEMIKAQRNFETWLEAVRRVGGS